MSMTNSLCGSMGSLKSENSCSKFMQPTSPNGADSVSEATSNAKTAAAPPSTDLEPNGALTPPSLNLPAVKFELDGEVEINSPDSSIWETFFSDHVEGDFMISSPVRNQSPRAYNGNYFHALQGQSTPTGCSPPRSLSQLGTFGSINHKGKGQSPLHKVVNSPNNNHFMQIESLSLPSMDDFLDDYDRSGDGYEGYGVTKQLFDMHSSVAPPPSLLDGLSLQGSSRFCAETSSGGGSQLTQDRDIYNQTSTIETAPLSQQLQQEHQQEKNQPSTSSTPPPSQQVNHGLMVPLPIGSEQDQDSGLQLVHLLLACAEAVAKEDYMLARRYLHHLNRIVTPLGDSMQRVASCFTEALSARLAATLTTKPSTSSSSPKPFSPFPPNSLEILKIYQILYQACPYIKFAHFTANQAIFEAFEAEERVHVIDLDILQGYQWPAFMQALAARPGGAPFLRITGVGPSIESVRETGRCLAELAHSLHVPFEFHPVGEELEDLKPHMFNRRVGEALAVNSVNRLHRVPSNYLGPLLAMIRDQAPNIVTLVEQEANHNGPYFLGRFLEALHYYSAFFDSLDATFPPDSAQRAKVEQYIFAPEIRNIVACEGRERTMRHERLEKWRKLMEGKGFKGVPLSANAVTQSKILLGLYSCDGYRLTEDKGCLLLGWQDRAILAASAWRC
ncbi:hypothetical protein HS088_TW15G01356 [Tripterygium wilfordii]|uniref:Uncharacterized protein n=1 Tax=Tripterygium wilfordii TaxID=458696 RepID=A0A7J7CP30_TRIWF|nr:GRAS family protein RAM1-like [Tripterygium wilfordii]KAF5735840.1 hypothetical protein HS088_TW15G01356 [Tripterygium wilfordii]